MLLTVVCTGKLLSQKQGQNGTAAWKTPKLTKGDMICLRPSIIPGGAPLITFTDYKSNCSRDRSFYVNIQGTHSPIFKQLYMEAGLTVVKNFTLGGADVAARVSFNSCCKQCFENKSNISSGMQINQVPGHSAMTNKRLLTSNIRAFQLRHPEYHDRFDLIPRTFNIPFEMEELEHHMASNEGEYFILKPSASSRGRGIYLINSTAQIIDPNAHSTVQEYISDAVLLDGYKFDLRLYWLITSVDPLIAYLYGEGIGRLATEKYEPPNAANSGDLRRHLTNFAVNSGDDKQIKTMDGGVRSKQLASEVLAQVARQRAQLLDGPARDGATPDSLWEAALNASRDALTAIYPDLLRRHMRRLRDRRGVAPPQFSGLYGADLMLLRSGRFRLLEVNLQPSLDTPSALDYGVKHPLVREALELTGLRYGRGTAAAASAYDQSLPGSDYSAEEKRVLLEVVDQGLRARDFRRIVFDGSLEGGKWNSLVRGARDDIQREIGRLRGAEAGSQGGPGSGRGAPLKDEM